MRCLIYAILLGEKGNFEHSNDFDVPKQDKDGAGSQNPRQALQLLVPDWPSISRDNLLGTKSVLPSRRMDRDSEMQRKHAYPAIVGCSIAAFFLSGTTSVMKPARLVCKASLPNGCGAWTQEHSIICPALGLWYLSMTYEPQSYGTCTPRNSRHKDRFLTRMDR